MHNEALIPADVLEIWNTWYKVCKLTNQCVSSKSGSKSKLTTQEPTSKARPSLKETMVEGKQDSLLILMIDLLHSLFRALKKHTLFSFSFSHTFPSFTEWQLWSDQSYFYQSFPRRSEVMGRLVTRLIENC